MMDSVDDIPASAFAADHAIEAPPSIGRDERRMHVRAYNVWVGMLGGRQVPDIAVLDPARIGDFAAHGVLLDFTGGNGDDPAVAWLGAALRAEGDIAGDVATIAQAPERSLLSRLTEHYRQVVVSRAPIGFEAEFVNVRDNTALYRGILMPFTSDDATIDYVYGVINWKEVVDQQTVAEIVAAARAAMVAPTIQRAAPIAPVWADGPSRTGPADARSDSLSPAGLGDMLPLLREAGDRWHKAELRARDALHQALGTAYDLAFSADADPEGYAALLRQTNVRAQPRRPWQPIVRLIFGDRLPRAAVGDYAAVLAHAWRHDVAPGELARFLAEHPEDLRGIAAAERAATQTDTD